MFHFDCRKMVQALAVLIKQPGRDQSNYYKLLKLLYIAEKESLIETGHPITGDVLVAMPHGPALSATCDLMRGCDSRQEWSEHIIPSGGDEIRLIAEPGDDLLCDYEVGKLVDVAKRHRDKTWRQMRRLCHKFPEQIKNDPGKSSKEIPLEDILGSEMKVKSAASIAEVQTSLARALGR